MATQTRLPSLGKTMNGTIAQLVALACHGNAILNGMGPSDFFPQNSTCTFCDRINFVSKKRSFLKKPTEKEIAATPQNWFQFLKASAAQGILLSRSPQSIPQFADRLTAGLVGGGGTWALEVLLPEHCSEFWIPHWDVWNQQAPEQRIWRVTYACTARSATRPSHPSDLQRTESRLKQALQEIHSFSSKQDCAGFSRCFADALDSLESCGKNLHGYHKDLAPAQYLSSQSLALLDACQTAWVFGGMGSWNDLGFSGEDQQEYERVSEQLFQILNLTICEVTNQSYYAQR